MRCNFAGMESRVYSFKTCSVMVVSRVFDLLVSYACVHSPRLNAWRTGMGRKSCRSCFADGQATSLQRKAAKDRISSRTGNVLYCSFVFHVGPELQIIVGTRNSPIARPATHQVPPSTAGGVILAHSSREVAVRRRRPINLQGHEVQRLLQCNMYIPCPGRVYARKHILTPENGCAKVIVAELFLLMLTCGWCLLSTLIARYWGTGLAVEADEARTWQEMCQIHAYGGIAKEPNVTYFFCGSFVEKSISN